MRVWGTQADPESDSEAGLEVAGPQKEPWKCRGKSTQRGLGGFGQILRVPSFPPAQGGGLDLSSTSPTSCTCRGHSVPE